MLTTLRKQSGSIVVKALLFLLIASFAAWGVQDWLSPAISSSSVAKVGEREIGPYEFRRWVNFELNRLRPMFGNQLTMDQAVRLGLVNAVLADQVNRALIEEAATGLGVTVSDNLVSRDIRSRDAFKGLAGRFDRSRFDIVLQNNGISEQTFIADTRRDLKNRQFTESLTNGLVAPKFLADSLYKHRNQKRIVDTVLVEDAAVTEIGEPDAVTLDAYHKENAARFTAPEYRKVTYVHLEAEELADEMSVSEEEIAASYDARMEEFSKPEKRHVQQLLVSDEEKAKAAENRLAEGADLATVAKEITGTEDAVLDLGEVTDQDLLPDIAANAFSVPEGEAGPAVKSALGWHIFKVLKVIPGGTQSLDEVRQQLKESVAREKAVDSLFDLSNRFEDELGGGATLEEAAANLGLKVKTVEAVSLRGQDANGKLVDGLPINPFIQTAFETDEGTESALTEAGPEAYFVLRVDKVTPPSLIPLDDVRDDVVAAWKAGQRQEAARDKAEAIAERLNAGDTIESVTAKWDVAAKTSNPFTRSDNGTQSGLTTELVGKVFDLKIGNAAFARSPEGYYVARLKEIIAVDPGSATAEVERIGDAVSAAIGGDIVVQLTGALRAEIPVNVNQRLVDEMFSGETQR